MQPSQNPTPNPSDEALAQAAAASPEAFSELYRRYLAPVYRFHLARTANPADAEDLTAQTFIAALEGLPRYRGQGVFAAWLFGIARHKTALMFRKQRREAPLESAEDLPDQADLPEALTHQSLLLQNVYHALASLPGERAEAILLCVFADLSSAEAGQILRKSPTAVRMLVSRGLRDVRERLDKMKVEA
jgi:RNA polymerase sigma-70 factor (ECF subfamily)